MPSWEMVMNEPQIGDLYLLPNGVQAKLTGITASGDLYLLPNGVQAKLTGITASGKFWFVQNPKDEKCAFDPNEVTKVRVIKSFDLTHVSVSQNGIGLGMKNVKHES